LNLDDLSYVVIGRNGDIDQSKAFVSQNNDFEFDIVSWMVPSIDVIVYLIHDNEIIYDRLRLQINPEPKRNVSCLYIFQDN